MAEADCGICAAMGHRSCDDCGNPIFPPFTKRADGRELCVYCLEELATH